jgi:hypothetical protein
MAMAMWLCWSITVALDDIVHAFLTLIGLGNQWMGSSFNLILLVTGGRPGF